MNVFAYQARDASGRIVSGTQEGLNEENAVNAIMQRGLMVLSIQQKAAGKVAAAPKKVSSDDLVMFTRQLSTMVDAGLPLVSAMNAIYEQCDVKKQEGLRRVVSEIIAQVQDGRSFSDSILKHPKVFSRLYIAMVRAGEMAGMLSEVLDRLAGFLESSARLSKKVKSALTYPVVVIGIALAITIFLIVVVVPVFGEVFKDFGAKLPTPTQILLDISAFAKSSWYIILGFLVAAFWGIKTFVSTKEGAQLWDIWKLKLPVFGPLLHKICMTRFARTFAQLIRAGVPILDVMTIVGETSGNYVVEQSIKRVAGDIEKGDPLGAAMVRQTIFPPMMLRMVAAGESTGKIDEMLERTADFWDTEIETTLNSLTSLLEPFMIVILGVIIGSIVMALLLPIFKLSDVVSS
jgi:type IV pilus assembly protein PilC